ncbi:transcription antitermination factor NusB [Lentilactobacillus laojiaonis]|uniref:transcription antitermination factor NusB n=1 Tax=Lentilactobacillus laojiaonis TaxID=2883998 RepID=UPI001D0AF8B1|nr:transcription antitermination factor NusB [Lentilactobacillus laojiaonis]UDM32635.1 transcription antitermination factor NusB [Lentilactobacillus laojiaonis]
MELNRHQIREIAFQTLFALYTNDQTDWNDFFQALTDGKYGEDYPEYLNTLISGVLDHRQSIDDTIKKYLNKSWSLDRLAKTDLIIIELAIYEMQYEDDVPEKVSINEAIELAKKFSDDRSRKFVNGILSHTLEESKK